MKILVMGTGGVGGYFGGVLARSGEDVTFVARGEHLDVINRDGLRVESVAVGDFTVRRPALERPDGAWKADVVLFCVKSYHSEGAIETIAPAVGEDTSILTLQNGVGSGDQLVDAFGRDRVLLGAVYIDAMRRSPGVVAQIGGPCRIVFGLEDGRQSPGAIALQEVFRRAGIDAQLSGDVLTELWNKLIFICALSGMTCIARASFSEVLDSPGTLDLTWRVMREAFEVGRAKGIGLDPGIVESTMSDIQRMHRSMISSMYLDLESGNPLEIAVLNGAISRVGREVGVATPVNDFITDCLNVADSKARSPS